MEPGEPVPVLVNRAASGAARVHQALREAGTDGAASIRECGPEALALALAEAVAAGTPVVAVAGGDGTQMTAAQALAGTDTALLPLPAGTLNHFAARSGVTTLAAGAALIRGGRVVMRPIGILDHVVFLNTAIIGAYPQVVRRRDRLRRVMPKWPAALLSFGVAGLRAPRRIRVVLEPPGGRLERTTTMIWIGVGHGSYPLPHEADHPGNTLEVAILRDVSRLAIARFLLRLLKHARLAGDRPTESVELFHTRRVLIHADQPIDATLDGEPRRFGSTVFVAVQDDGLKVVVP